MVARPRPSGSCSPAADTVDGEPVPLMQVRLDGKTARGAVDAEGNQVHLLGCSGQSTVVAVQTEVAPKPTTCPKPSRRSTRSSWPAPWSPPSLHTVKATAVNLHRWGGFFLLQAKEDRRALFEACDTLPWAHTPIAHQHTDTGYGRITRHTIRVPPVPDALPFPYVKQVYLIEWYVTDTAGKSPSAVAALSVTNLTAAQAGPAQMAAMSETTGAVESPHWLRDTCYREDTSRPTLDPAPESSRPCATWSSAHYAWPAVMTSLKPPDGPTAA